MFKLGELVICIDDSPDTGCPCNVKKGAVYTVKAFYPAGFGFPLGYTANRDLLGVGVPNEALKKHWDCKGLSDGPVDLWDSTRFQRLERNEDSIQQSKTIFRKMADDVKALEVVGK